MKVIVSIEIGGVEQKDFHQEIKIPVSSEHLSLEELITLLQSSGIKHPLTPDSIISYYNDDRHSYRTLKKLDKFRVQETLKILVRHSSPDKIYETLKLSLSELTSRLNSIIHKREPVKKSTKVPSKPLIPRQISELDIAVLGATPLVCESGPIENCALDFEVERRKLIENFMGYESERSHKGANLRFEIATLENLAEILEAKPKILYLICQGFYRKQPTAEFVLAFEQSFEGSAGNRIGCIDEVTWTQLKQVFDNSPRCFQVVIIKGAYSQEMAKVLRKAGFPCVVAVHQLPEKPLMQEIQTIDDFITDFCLELMSGKSVNDTFKTLTERFSEKESCCCAHEHDDDCKWLRELNLSSIYENHKFHLKNCTCATQFQKHKTNCTNTNTYFMKEHPELYFNMQDSEFLLFCCCKHNLEGQGLDHQGFNFTIHCADDSCLENMLFEDHKRSQLNIISELPVSWKPPYLISITDARRKEIHQLLRLVGHNRCVNLYGEAGMGKTTLLKRAGFYAYERRLFADGVVYFDFTKKDIVFLYRTISKTLNLPVFNHYTELFSVLNNKDVLLIMDNIDELVCDENKTNFLQTYDNFIKFTSKPKFLIGCVNKLDLKNAEFFELPGLNEEQKLRFIQRRLGNCARERFLSTSSNPSELILFIESQKNRPGTAKNPTSPELEIYNILSRKALGSTHFFNILKFIQFGAYKCSLEEIWVVIQKTYPEAKMALKDMLASLLGHPDISKFLIAEPGQEFFKLRYEFLNILLSQSQSMAQTHFYFKVAMKSLANISRSILLAALKDKFKIGYEGRNSLTYVNGGLAHSIWARGYSEGQEHTSTLLVDKVYDPSLFFEKIEYNFWHYIKEADLKKIFPDLSKVPEEVKASLAEIILSTVSIFTLFGNTRDAMEYIERSRVCCKVFSLDLTCQLITLIQLSIFINESRQAEVFPLVSAVEAYFEDLKDKEGLAECLLIKALATEKVQEKLSLLQDSREHFRQANCLPGYARSTLAYIEVKNSIKEMNEDIEKLCIEVSEIFERAGLKFWKTRSDLHLASCYFHLEKLNLARDSLESTLKSVRLYKDSARERVIICRLQEINEHIVKNNKNSICLLKAFPLIEKVENDVITNVGCLWRLSSPFRVDLMRNLDSLNRKIYIRMDTASSEKLQMCLNEKPAILHLASEMQAADFIYLEKENGIADPLSFESFKSVFIQSPSYQNLKLLVFAMPFSLLLGERSYQELGIHHVVCFGFPLYPQHSSKVLLNLAFEKSIHHFCVSFYTYLGKQETLNFAFKKAKGEMIEFMERELNKFPYLDLDTDLNVIDWWNLHKEDDPVLIDPENPQHDQPVLEFADDSIGKKVELSSIRGPCNLRCDGLPQNTYVGRQGEIYNIMSILRQTRCINLFGSEGMGKTELAKQIGYYLYVRNKYPDGIYLIDLKDHHTLEDVYRVFKNEGISGFSIDIDPKTFLLDKKILFILENCEAMIQRAPHTFNSLLKKFVNECKISVIITSNSHLPKNEIPEMRRIALRTMIRFEIYVYLCLVLPQFVSRPLVDEGEKENFHKVIDKLLKKFQGIPGKVHKYINLLEHRNIGRIMELLDDDFDVLALPPDLNFKRSSSTTLNELRKPPVLTSGRSSCEFNFKHKTIER